MIFCSECGQENYKDVKFCTSCGKKIRVYSEGNSNSNLNSDYKAVSSPQKVSIKAFTSLIFGILSVVFIFIVPNITISILLAIIGAVFGVISMKEIVDRESKSIARFGVILCVFTFVFMIFFVMEI